MKACTVIARNYLAHARVLAKSFRRYHRDAPFHVLLLDDRHQQIHTDNEHDEAFHLVRPHDIMEADEFERLALVYDVTELATAVKARFMTHLLDTGQTEVLFFDPDIQIFAPLDDIAELARRHSIVLTPHDLEPLPRDQLQPGEIQLLQSGAYNLGFIALGEGSRPFLAWWDERLRRHCLASPEQGLFVDQKWVDFVPGYFDHHILKDPGCNVAYWNLSNRHLTRNGTHYRVNDRPLRFFHFSGFDPDKPHVLSRHSLPAPRVLLSERPELRKLCDGYAKELLEQGYETLSQTPYDLGVLGNGLVIERRMRRIYRDALLAFEQGTGVEPPRPGHDADAFVRWLNEPAVRSPAASVSRYLHAVYCERPDLKAAFPDLAGEDGEPYLAWVRERGARECQISEPFLPPTPSAGDPRARAPANRSVSPGVNVVGYFRAELGVGESARQLVAAVERAGIPHQTLTLENTLSRQEHPFSERFAETPYDVNLICVNADELPARVKQLGREYFEGRYTVGVWHWELSSFPERWHDAFELVDEIWVASEHVTDALSVVSSRPVHVIPPPVTLASVPSSTRAELGVPDRFAFLFIYDFMSVWQRKNPLALIEAFTRAFAPGEGPVLVLKSINGDKRTEDLERVKLAASKHPDILVIDRYFSRGASIGLVACCDAYVSLHRAEGFGLTMAEAMALGKPVIATAYSGNMMYMRQDTAFLVRYHLEPIPEGAEPYPAGAEWAEPDVAHAADLMRHVYEHPREALEKGRRAREDILREHSVAVRAELIKKRLDAIRSRGRAEPEAATEPGNNAPDTKTSEDAGAPDSMEPSKHELAHARAREFPASAWKSTSQYRPALPAARAALLRLLRPYTASLQAVHAAMLDDALELRERVDRYERERVEALQNELSETRAALLEMIRDIDRRVELLAGQTLPAVRRESAAGRERVAERLAELEERIALVEQRHVETHVEQLQSDVSRFQDGAKAHLASLTDHTGALEDSLDRFRRELHSLPYTAEPIRREAERATEDMAYDSGARESSGAADFYSGFEDVFRGPEASVRERLRPYVDMLKGHQPVVDLGCGRGELLDLLAESGIAAVGVDVHPGRVERCTEKGHQAEIADAVAYLSTRADGSLGCVFSAHVIEHLPFDALLELFRLSRSKLVQGGVLIAETVNPHSIAAMKHFWIDPTHQKPIFPEVALTLCRLHGFESARIIFPRGSGSLDADLWEQGEYAVVATRA